MARSSQVTCFPPFATSSSHPTRRTIALSHSALPSSLVRLVFLARPDFNQPLAPGVLPPILQRLSFNGAYRQPFGADVLPSSLRELHFRWSCVQEVARSSMRRLIRIRSKYSALAASTGSDNSDVASPVLSCDA